MHTVTRLLRRTNYRVWTAPSVLEKSAWSGFDRLFFSSKSESSDDESSATWEKVMAEENDNLPGPSGRGSVKDAEWWARDSKAQAQAMALLSAALDEADDDEEPRGEGESEEPVVISEEDQKSLRVGILGSPNSGKSTLTNYMVSAIAIAPSNLSKLLAIALMLF